VYEELKRLYLLDLDREIKEEMERIDAHATRVRMAAAIHVAARKKGLYVPVEVICKVTGANARAVWNVLKKLRLGVPSLEECVRYVAKVIAAHFWLEEDKVYEKILEIAKKFDESSTPLVRAVAAAYLASGSLRVKITQRWLSEKFGVADHSIRLTVKKNFNEKAVKLKYAF